MMATNIGTMLQFPKRLRTIPPIVEASTLSHQAAKRVVNKEKPGSQTPSPKWAATNSHLASSCPELNRESERIEGVDIMSLDRFTN